MVSLIKLPVKALLAMLLGVFLITGCSVLEKSGAWVNPEVKVASSRLVGLTLTKALLEVELDVSNPNRYPLVLGALDFQLDLQGAKILAGQQLQGNSLAAGKTQQIILPLEIEFSELSSFVTNLSDLNALAYLVSGGMSFDIPVAGPLRVPYETKGEIPIPRIPKFSLAGVEQKRLSLTGADLVVSVELDNPNAFDLLVNQLQYSLKLNGHSITSGGLADSIKVAADGKSKVDIPVNLSFGLSSVGVFYNLLKTGGDLDYELDLNSELGSSLPLLSSFPFDAKREGKVQLSK
ncbi:MAG: hypothetical protein GX029_06795 [Pseudomonadaceae bacterium]|nr:hypothetical protein [Pseudomonadaceae bacterium]